MLFPLFLSFSCLLLQLLRSRLSFLLCSSSLSLLLRSSSCLRRTSYSFSLHLWEELRQPWDLATCLLKGELASRLASRWLEQGLAFVDILDLSLFRGSMQRKLELVSELSAPPPHPVGSPSSLSSRGLFAPQAWKKSLVLAIFYITFWVVHLKKESCSCRWGYNEPFLLCPMGREFGEPTRSWKKTFYARCMIVNDSICLVELVFDDGEESRIVTDSWTCMSIVMNLHPRYASIWFKSIANNSCSATWFDKCVSNRLVLWDFSIWRRMITEWLHPLYWTNSTFIKIFGTWTILNSEPIVWNHN